ncbi:MAG TPA: hypothetical protein VGP06_10060 [Janthinobacterium sp.]|jgi:hypothetical protein|nr:hypothetical protein [Janthinobacterium sp.]
MTASRDTYTRRQGLRKTYSVEYTSMRYKITLDGKVLKEVKLPLQSGAARGAEASWASAASDIEFLRGMPEQ